MNNYLIPANSKKSQLILGFFNKIDLFGIFLPGIGLTVFLLFAFKSNNVIITVLDLLPALIAAFLVMPVPNYHNMFTLLSNVHTYFSRRRKYYWRGWCANGKDH